MSYCGALIQLNYFAAACLPNQQYYCCVREVIELSEKTPPDLLQKRFMCSFALSSSQTIFIGSIRPINRVPKNLRVPNSQVAAEIFFI